MALDLFFSHVVLKVRDLDTMLEFYTNVLEFDVVDRGPLNLPSRGDLPPLDTEIVFLSQDPTNHHQIAMLGIRDDDSPANSVDHHAFRTGSLADVQNLVARLEERDIRIRAVSHGNTWSAYFSDPERNGIEVYCDTPFAVDQPQAVPVDLSRSEDELLAWTKERFGDEARFEDVVAYHGRRHEELAARTPATD